jgi:hypothetical protein
MAIFNSYVSLPEGILDDLQNSFFYMDLNHHEPWFEHLFPMCVPQALGYNCHSNNEEQQGMPRARG